MSVTRTGEWLLAKRILGALPKQAHAAVQTALRQEAQALRTEIIGGITRQAPGGEAIRPLSELTLARRQMVQRFTGSKALIVRGDLRGSVVAVARGDEAFVGVLRKARGKAGQPLVNVAQVQEFGSDPIVIPVTPKMRRFLFALYRRAGQEPSGSGGGAGVVVVRVPPRPFLRPAFREWSKDAQRRFLRRVARLLGTGE